MATPTRRVETVEEFATISAKLADPFASRAEVLAESALDDDAWSEAVARYRQSLGEAARRGNDTKAISSYRVAFESARAEIAARQAPARRSAAPTRSERAPEVAGPTREEPQFERPTFLQPSLRRHIDGRTTAAAPTPEPLSRVPASLPTPLNGPRPVKPPVGAETSAMPLSAELARMIREADPRVAIPRGPAPVAAVRVSSTTTDECRTEALPPPEEIRRLAAQAQPFSGAEGRVDENGRSTELPAKASAAPVGSETESLDLSAVIAAINAKATPFAAGAGTVVPTTHRGDVPPPQGETGTALDIAGVRESIAAAAIPFQESPKAAGIEPTERSGVAELELLAAIAVDIRRGTSPSVAISRHGLTDGAWRAAQQAVVQDPEKRRSFERRIDALMRQK